MKTHWLVFFCVLSMGSLIRDLHVHEYAWLPLDMAFTAMFSYQLGRAW